MSEHEHDDFDDEDIDEDIDEDDDFDDEDYDDEDDESVDLDDEVAPEGNRIVGATARQVLEYVTKAIVDDPEGVFIDTDEGNGQVTFHVHVAPDDMGRVIGKRGRVANAIRAVVAAAAYDDGISTEVEFED